MTRYKWMMGGVLSLALGLVVFTYFHSTTVTPPDDGEADPPAAVSRAGNAAQKPDSFNGGSAKEAKSVKKQQGSKKDTLKKTAAERSADGADKEQKTDPEAKAAAAEQAVAAWETLVDELVDAKGSPDKERKERVKEAFDKLDAKDQMDAIQRSLNLLPDEQFTSLFGILYDKTENPELLDAIFSDALNRPEEIKVPMMKDFVFDKTHPMFFESARILDVTGELDKMADGGAAKADDEETMAEEDAPAEDEPAAP